MHAIAMFWLWIKTNATAFLVGIDVGFAIGVLWTKHHCRPLFCARCHIEVHGIEKIRLDLRKQIEGPQEFKRWWQWWKSK